MKSGDEQGEAYFKATPEQLRKAREGLMAQDRRKRPAALRIGVLVFSTMGLGIIWYLHGWPEEPYFILLLVGFFSVALLLWSVSLSLDNIADDLLTIAHPVQLLFYGPDKIGMSNMGAYNLRRKLGMQIEYDWEERIAEQQNRF